MRKLIANENPQLEGFPQIILLKCLSYLKSSFTSIKQGIHFTDWDVSCKRTNRSFAFKMPSSFTQQMVLDCEDMSIWFIYSLKTIRWKTWHEQCSDRLHSKLIFINSFVLAQSSVVCMLFLMSPLHPSKTFRISIVLMKDFKPNKQLSDRTKRYLLAKE